MNLRVVFVAAAAAAVVLASVSGAPARQAANPTLHAEVGAKSAANSFAISLKDAAGHSVTALSAGAYSVKVDDWASVHNFHLFGPTGSPIATPIGATKHVTQTVTFAPGTYTYQCDAHVESMIATFKVFAADGSGTMTASPTTVAHGATGRTIVFTYTAAAGGLSNGTVSLTVPAGWSAPSVTKTAGGYSTTNKGKLAVSSRTINVTGVTLAAGAKMTITFGSKAGRGPGATAPSTASTQTWAATERSTASGAAKALKASPAIKVS